MLKLLYSLFLFLHALIHLLYYGQSRQLFELQPGLAWPDDSWIFSRYFTINTVRFLACVCCILAATGFITGGYGILIGAKWWRPVVLITAAFSSLLFILFWDGGRKRLPEKGGIGLLINAAIILILLLFP
jgi:hypothetical protein